MAGVNKAIRSAIRTAKNMAGKIDKSFSSPSSIGGRDPLARGGVPGRHKNLASWMAGSKIVNDDGSPKVMYHGTRSDFKSFGRIDGGNAHGDGYYFTPDPKKASDYATGENVNRITLEGNSGPNVMPVHLRATKVLDLTRHGRDAPLMPKTEINHLENSANKIYPKSFKKGELASTFDRGYPPTHSNVHSWLQSSVPDVTKVIRRAGYDGLNTDYGVVVFDPSQIKSAIGNSGSFDPDDTDITKRAGGRVGMFAGGTPDDPGQEPQLPIKIDDGATPDAPHTIFDMDGNTNFFSGPLRAGPNSRSVRLNRGMVGYAEDPQTVYKHVEKHPVDSVVAGDALHRLADKDMRHSQIKHAHKYLKPGGKAYFIINEGNGSAVHGKDAAGFGNNNLPAVHYMNEIKKVFPKVHRIEHVIIGQKEA